MRRTVLDSATKEVLRKAVRGLRGSLLEALEQAAEREYRLQTSLERAQLPVERRVRRERLEAWLEEQVRATPAQARKGKGAEKAIRERFRSEAVKEAAYTLLNRLMFVRIMEHHGLIKPALVSGGWDSAAYRDEFVHYSHALQGDDTRGYAALLEQLYAELALDLPGLFGPVGLTQLFPVPAASLREVIAALNEKALDRAWGDDMTLGWVYQFWNDPEREALDRKISEGGKIESHEIASKTQMFTERYMVEWLLHNSLGQTWLAICAKNGWTPDFHQVRDVLDARRADWRRRREAREVALDALMPLESELEERWKYWVPQPLPEEAVASAPGSIRELKLLDPACGSGHFLLVAFDLLVALYEEEAQHQRESWSSEEIAQSIVENNLHGVDIDPRAVQLAAAGLWLKARLYASEVALRGMNLVAPVFRLAGLPKNDPAFERLCVALDAFPVPRQRKLDLMQKLAGVDYLGTLLHVDGEIHKFLEQARGAVRPGAKLDAAESREALRQWFADFLDAHAAHAQLGLRLDGEQVAAGVRFLEIVRDGAYDVVVGNPPYEKTSRLAEAQAVAGLYPRAGTDLYACFLERSLGLAKPGGISALLTMRGWMFLSQYQALREGILGSYELVLLGDVDRGAFEDIRDELVSTTMSIIAVRPPGKLGSIAVQPTPLDDRSRDSARTARKRAALLAQVGRHEFDVATLSDVLGTPVIYWWNQQFLREYIQAPKLGEGASVWTGCQTSRDPQFLRMVWEVPLTSIRGIDRHNGRRQQAGQFNWAPIVAGAEGRQWFEPLTDVIKWNAEGLELRVFPRSYPRNMDAYFGGGVAFSDTGNRFVARLHCYPSVIGDKGPTVVVSTEALKDATLCMMNRSDAKSIIVSLNPGLDFQVGDVKRLPILDVDGVERICAVLRDSFWQHERHRESSIEFQAPGSSSWWHAQAWAQRAVDRSKGEPLPRYEAECVEPEPWLYVSYAIGVALGRFGANGEGILTEASATALPDGILYIAGAEALADSLAQFAAARIVAAWVEHGPSILNGDRRDLRGWLRDKFFACHKALYANRPIYLPLSSTKKSFVAFISIHRWTDSTLQTLLADYLKPNLRQLDAAITESMLARANGDRKASTGAEQRLAEVKRLRDELSEFIDLIKECAERGAPPTGAGCPLRTADAAFHMDLDDGVMINSAALWPLLEPHWKDPRKWWKELCEAKGRKDYDWSHLAARYFPERVDEKCRIDPSLAVAHGCFWRYHPAKAYTWELRLAQEIGPDFAICEKDAAAHRVRFLSDHAERAARIQQKERERRERLRIGEAASERGSEFGPEPTGPGLAKGIVEPPEDEVVRSDELNDEEVAV